MPELTQNRGYRPLKRLNIQPNRVESARPQTIRIQFNWWNQWFYQQNPIRNTNLLITEPSKSKTMVATNDGPAIFLVYFILVEHS